MNRQKKIWALLSVLLLLTACRTVQDASQHRIALQSAQKEERIATIIDQALRYNSLSAPLTARISIDGKKNSVDGQLRIKRGECVQISLRMPLIGSELFRLQITPEQFIIIDRYNKQYMAESIQDLKKEYPFDFDYQDLEALFSNQLFLPGTRDVRSAYQLFDLKEDEYRASLNYTDKQGIDYSFQSDYTHRILETTLAREDMGINLQWVYADFMPSSNRQLFPMKEEIIVHTTDDEFRLTLSFKAVDVDADFTIDYKLPTKYTRIGFDEFIEMMKHLL